MAKEGFAGGQNSVNKTIARKSAFIISASFSLSYLQMKSQKLDAVILFKIYHRISTTNKQLNLPSGPSQVCLLQLPECQWYSHHA